MTITIPSHLTDASLMTAAAGLAGDERDVTARLVAHLVEIDRRRLYLPAGHSSMYWYCREGLGYSEDAAFNRAAAARVARRYPAAIDMLSDGRLSLTALKLLAPVLKDDNWERVFAEAAHLPKRDIEKLVACLDPKPDIPSVVRRITASAPPPEKPVLSGELDVTPEPAQAGPPAAGRAEEPEELDRPPRPQPQRAGQRPIVAPLSPERYRVQFTIGEETEKKLRRVQTLLRREIPDGDPALIFDRALTLLLARVESRKHGVAAKPRSSSPRTPATPGTAEPGGETVSAEKGPRPRRSRPRTMPAAVRRRVVRRDEAQCTFVGTDGRRCTERAYLEFHHAGVPFAHGGAETVKNIALHCRAHNAYEGARIFGRHLPREIREARILYDAMLFAVPERRP